MIFGFRTQFRAKTTNSVQFSVFEIQFRANPRSVPKKISRAIGTEWHGIPCQTATLIEELKTRSAKNKIPQTFS